MNLEKNDPKPMITGRLVPLSVFLICSLVLFEPPFFTFNSTSKPFQIVTFIGLPILFSIMAALARRLRRMVAYWPAFCSFVMVFVSLFLMWLLDDFPRRWLALGSEGAFR